MRRGEAAARLDVDFNTPRFQALRQALENGAWPAQSIGSLATYLKTGFAAGLQDQAPGNEVGVPHIRPLNLLENGNLTLEGTKRVPYESVSPEDLCQRGEVLFNNTNSPAWVGKSVVFDLPDSCACSNHITRIGCSENVVLPRFLAESLNTLRSIGFFKAISTSFNNQAGVNSQTLAEIKIPLPPLDIQRRLVAELDAARAERDRALAEAERLPSKLDADISHLLGISPPQHNQRQTYGIRLAATRSTRLDAAYHHPRYKEALRALQAGIGDKLVLGDLLLDVAGGATPKAKDDSLYAASGIKFLRILNIRPNRLDFADLNFIRQDVHEGLLKRSRLEAGDVLMTITGRVGTAAVVSKDDLPANINQHIVRMRIDASRCLPRYLAAFLNTGLGLLLSNRSVSGGTRIALDYGAIRQIPILLPALDVQKKVVELVEHSGVEETRLRAHAETVWQQARQRFEQQLLKGAGS